MGVGLARTGADWCGLLRTGEDFCVSAFWTIVEKIIRNTLKWRGRRQKGWIVNE